MASVSDNFNRANESPIGGNWETILNGLRLDANSIDAVTASVHSISAWRSAVNAFAADQRVDFTYTALSAFDKAGPAVRCSVGTGGNAYFFRADGAAADNDNGLHKLVNGVLTRLVSYTTAIAVNDVVRLEAIGTTIKVYRNGTEIISVTDTSLASGQPGGYYFFDNSNATQIDNFVATDELSAAAAVSSRRRSHAIYPVPGPYNSGQFQRRRGSTFIAQTLVEIAASDTLAPGITDAVSAIAASLAVSDTLAPGVTDALSSIAATLAVSDTVTVQVVDAAALLASLSASDTLAPGITDAAAIAVVIAASDTLAPGITDAVSAIAASLAVSDTLATGVTDAASVTIVSSTLGKMLAIIAIKPALGAAPPDVKPSLGGNPTLH